MSTAVKSKPSSGRPSSSGRRPGGQNVSRAATVDPFRVLRRHMLLIIAAAFLGGGLGVGAFYALSYLYPLYSGVVLFEVKPGVSEASDVGTPIPLKEEDIARIANTELVLLSSRSVLTSAIKDPDVQSATTWFKTNYTTSGGLMVEDAVDDLEESIKRSLVRGTQLFSIEWSTHDRDDVPIVLNAVAEAYMKERRRLDDNRYGDNLKLFKEQLDETSREIRELDAEMQNFIRDSGITTLDDSRFSEKSQAIKNIVDEITLTTQGIDMTRTRLQQTAARLEGTMEPSAEDVAIAENDFSVATHIRTVETLRVALRVARDSFEDSHRAVITAETQLRAAEAEKKAKTSEIIKRNLNARLRTFSSELQGLEGRLVNLEKEHGEKSDELSELAAKQGEYQAMQMQRDNLEDARDAELGLIKSLELMKSRTDAERVDIVQIAETPRERSFPQAPIIVPLALVLTVGLVVGLIFLREITDQRVKTASDLAILPGSRVLGVIPDIEEDPTKCKDVELVVRREPTSIMAESYRQTYTPIAKAVDRNGFQSIVFIGGLPGAGTTSAVSNVAACFAASGRTVAVVDANFRRPRLAQVFGLEGESIGLGDVLAGEATVEEALSDSEFGIKVLAAGTPASRIIERLGTEAFDRIVAEMRGRFDVVLFDTPPAVVAGDALAIAGRLDAAVFVVRANREQRGLVARLISQIADSHCTLIGLVLNRPRGTAGGYFKKNYATMAEYSAKS